MSWDYCQERNFRYYKNNTKHTNWLVCMPDSIASFTTTLFTWLPNQPQFNKSSTSRLSLYDGHAVNTLRLLSETVGEMFCRDMI